MQINPWPNFLKTQNMPLPPSLTDCYHLDMHFIYFVKYPLQILNSGLVLACHPAYIRIINSYHSMWALGIEPVPVLSKKDINTCGKLISKTKAENKYKYSLRITHFVTLLSACTGYQCKAPNH